VRARLARGFAIAWVTLSLVSCGSETPAAPTGQPPPAVSALLVVGLEAPAKPGESAQYNAVAVMSGGGAQVVTHQARWLSSLTSVATVNSDGKVTAVAPGEADIIAVYENVPGKLKMTVLPAASDPR
jgi:hypothetical protein